MKRARSGAPRQPRHGETHLHRLRQLLNTYSARWLWRHDRLLMIEEEEDEMGVPPAARETELARCASADVAEMLVLLRSLFWPLWNELVMTRKKLADATRELAKQTRKE